MITSIRVGILLVTVLFFGLLVQRVSSEPNGPDAGEEGRAIANSTSWVPAAPGEALSVIGDLGFDPTIVSADDGDLMAVFSQGPTTANSDPYVSISTNGGITWSGTPIQIHSRADFQANVTGVYTADGTGHVLWVETGTDGVGSGTDFRVLYANSTNWSTTFAVISDRPNDSAVVEDLDVASHENNIYAVWVENDSIGFGSKSGSGAWNTTQALATVVGGDTSRPAIATDDNGGLHVAFVRQSINLVTFESTFQVEYTQSFDDGGVWTTPVVVYAGLDLREHVDILAANGVVHLTFGDNEPQSLRALRALDNRDLYMRCDGECAQTAESWGTADHPSTFTFDVYGADPNNLIPVLARSNSTVFLYFHGVVNGETFERIVGVNSCNGWGTAPGLDLVPTVGNKRAIRPSLTFGGNVVHMVFESVYFDGADIKREIRYMGTPFDCTNQAFFPIVFNQ